MNFWIEPTGFADRLQDALVTSFLWGMLLAGPAVLASSLLWAPRLKQRWLQAIMVLWLVGTVVLVQQIGPYQLSTKLGTTSWLGVAWIAGSVISLGILVWKIFCAWRFGASSREPEPELYQLFFEEKRGLRAKNVRLLVNSDMGTELAVCRHRTVFVSPDLQDTLTESQVRAVLRHEIAHAINRHWIQWVFESILLTTLFWHPFGWWLIGALHEAREMESDDAARQIDRLGYAEALLKLQKVKRQSWIFAFGLPCKARWKRLADSAEPPTFFGTLFARSVTGTSILLAGLIGQLLLDQGKPGQMRAIIPPSEVPEQRIRVIAITSTSSAHSSASSSSSSSVIVR